MGAETSRKTNLFLYIKPNRENPIHETLVEILAGSLTSGCGKEILRFGLINLGRLYRKESNNSTYDLRSSGLRTKEDKSLGEISLDLDNVDGKKEEGFHQQELSLV